MNIVRYREDELPPMTAEREAELRALVERPDSEIDFSDIPESDELDFKYSISGPIWNALSSKERSELGRKLQAAKEAERAALAKTTLFVTGGYKKDGKEPLTPKELLEFADRLNEKHRDGVRFKVPADVLA